MLQIAISILAACVSAFSLGFSTALYITSEFSIRRRVEKHLREELNKRCHACPLSKEIKDSTMDPNDTTKAAVDR